jgi:hypothetical protein
VRLVELQFGAGAGHLDDGFVLGHQLRHYALLLVIPGADVIVFKTKMAIGKNGVFYSNNGLLGFAKI